MKLAYSHVVIPWQVIVMNKHSEAQLSQLLMLCDSLVILRSLPQKFVTPPNIMASSAQVCDLCALGEPFSSRRGILSLRKLDTRVERANRVQNRQVIISVSALGHGSPFVHFRKNLVNCGLKLTPLR